MAPRPQSSPSSLFYTRFNSEQGVLVSLSEWWLLRPTHPHHHAVSYPVVGGPRPLCQESTARVEPFDKGLREAENWDEPRVVITSHAIMCAMMFDLDFLSRADAPIPQLQEVSLLMIQGPHPCP